MKKSNENVKKGITVFASKKDKDFYDEKVSHTENYYANRHKYDTKDPVYYNLTLNSGYESISNPIVDIGATFKEINSTPILFDSGDWFVSLMRCSIPTYIIPRMIFPIQVGLTQNNINLAYNSFIFKYATAPNTYSTPVLMSNFQQYVTFQSEVINPLPVNTDPLSAFPLSPQNNNGVQDVSGFYYWIYDVISLVSMFNDTLANLWALYRVAMNAEFGVVLPIDSAPFFTYNDATQLFSFNANSTLFDQKVFPRIEVYCDTLTAQQTLVPNKYNAKPQYGANDTTLLTVYNLFDNKFNYVSPVPNTYVYYKMEADQSGPIGWAAFQKIIFEVTGDILLKHNETDSIPLNFQQPTQQQYQKPLISMLTDLEVDKNSFAQSTLFIQYQQSSIEEVRLLRMSHRSVVQNFTLSIYWIDNYGNRRLLDIPKNGNPLTVKLAFYNKDFKG